MKRKATFVVGFLLALGCLPTLQAQDNAALKKEVTALYDKTNQYCAAKDVEGFMSLYTDDFQVIMTGEGSATRSQFAEVFKTYGEMRADYSLLDISASGKMIKVMYDSKIEGKSGAEDWKVLSQGSAVDFLTRVDGVLKIARSAQLDKYRLDNVKGQNYKDEQIGFSFTAPSGWEIFPSVHPIMKGTVYVLAPDKTSVALFGFVKAPGADPKVAAEADEALGKQMSDQSTYELYKSGPISVSGHKGYEMESRFHIPSSQDRHRRRVYFTSGDLLYVLCFDAIPYDRWPTVKDDYQLILNSIKTRD